MTPGPLAESYHIMMQSARPAIRGFSLHFQAPQTPTGPASRRIYITLAYIHDHKLFPF
jgi:hypothetical protein